MVLLLKDGVQYLMQKEVKKNLGLDVLALAVLVVIKHMPDIGGNTKTNCMCH